MTDDECPKYKEKIICGDEGLILFRKNGNILCLFHYLIKKKVEEFEKKHG